jgi:hypothetical protein
MDEENRLVPVQLSRALADAETNALAPVAIEELATKVVAALDLIAAIIPDLRTPHPATAKKVRGARTVPSEAVLSIVAMVESSRVLQSMNLLDTGRAHEVLECDDGFRVLDERLERLRGQVRYTIEARWAEIVSAAMDAYHMARRLAKEPRYADLAAHVAIIRRHLDRTNGTTGKKQKKKDPKPV